MVKKMGQNLKGTELAYSGNAIDRFHWRGQQLCKFLGIKSLFCDLKNGVKSPQVPVRVFVVNDAMALTMMTSLQIIIIVLANFTFYFLNIFRGMNGEV